MGQLDAIEDTFLDHCDKVIEGKCIDDCRAHATARRTAGHEQGIHSIIVKNALQGSTKKPGGLEFMDDDVRWLRRDLLYYFHPLRKGLCFVFIVSVIFPWLAPGFIVVLWAYARRINNGNVFSARFVDELAHDGDGVPGFLPAAMPDALDRLEHRLPAITHPVVIHIDYHQGGTFSQSSYS